MKEERVLDSVTTNPLLLENFISRIEYQAIFLLIIKQEQETNFQKQVEMLEDGKELPYPDPLADAAPFIDEKTGLLKSKGRVGYDMKPQRELEFVQEFSEHYLIILQSQ